MESGSFGVALQAGVDIGVTKDVFVNVDVKKIWIATDVKLDGAKIGNGCVVAAGAVVKGSFPDNCVLGGVPAKVIKCR